MRTPISVAVTGAAGNIGYSLLWRLASGDCFGADQPVILKLLEVTPALDKLAGVIMEIEDSALPLVHGIVGSDNPSVAFAGVKAAFLVGSRPRTKDMDRADLVRANGPIFVGQGQALASAADPSVRVLVVGNPCNTNALIARANAKSLPSAQFTAMTRLDQNRAEAQISKKSGAHVASVRNLFVWGNHADTMYPDLQVATINERPAAAQLDEGWLRGEFIQTVATRGKAIIVARGASSAASAASAAVDHMRDWWKGTDGRVVSIALPSQGWYGVPEGLVFSFPCRVSSAGVIEVVQGMRLDDFGRAKLAENIKDLEIERTAVSDLL